MNAKTLWILSALTLGLVPVMAMAQANAAMSGMKTGIADMKTAPVPQLQEIGTYTVTGNEDWKMQTGFGHNAPMVGMMNRMMIGSSGAEGMKMAPMSMKFGPRNYSRPEGDATGTGDMAGMDMTGKGSGMKMDAPAAGGAGAGAAAASKVMATISAPKAGDNALHITVTDALGKPVTGAKIATTVEMTSMDMGTTHPAVRDMGNGQYAATVNFGMAGPWRVTVNVMLPVQKPIVKSFDFTAK